MKEYKNNNIMEIEFLKIVNDIMLHPLVEDMKNMPQHKKGVSKFHHSVYVSYTSYKVCKRLGFDATSAARAGLLHDFVSENERNKGNWFTQIFNHSQIALELSISHFDLSKVEKDIIKTHMWPLNLFSIPKYKESFIVNVIDTYCATVELLGRYNNTKAACKISNLQTVLAS